MTPPSSAFRTAAISALLLLAATPLAAETPYTSRASFEAAIGALGSLVEVETFDADRANAATISFALGTQSAGTNGLGSPINEVTAGAWSAKVRTAAGVDGYRTITWTFPRPTRAFGVDWSSISSTRGITVTGDWDGTGAEPYLLWDQIGTSNAFFGVVGTVPFTQVTITAEGTGDNDFFGGDNLTLELPTGIFDDGFETSDFSVWDTVVGGV